MSDDGQVIYLIGEEHLQHPLHWLLTPKTATKNLQPTEDGGMMLPAGSELVKLECIICGDILEEGVDYRIGSPTVDSGTSSTKGGWKQRHKELYPDSLTDDREWFHEHRELYEDKLDQNWLEEHRRLYGTD